jgi:hypothetical protein
MDRLERFLSNLESTILEEARVAYGEKGCRRWRKTVDDVADITGDAVRAAIGRLPPEDRHCADLAAAAVQEALHNCLDRQRGAARPV